MPFPIYKAFKWTLNEGPFTLRDRISWPLVASSKWSLNQGKIYREWPWGDLKRSFKASGRLREVVAEASLTV